MARPLEIHVDLFFADLSPNDPRLKNDRNEENTEQSREGGLSLVDVQELELPCRWNARINPAGRCDFVPPFFLGNSIGQQSPLPSLLRESAVVCCLQFKHFRITSATAEKLTVRPLLGDRSVFENKYAVRHPDG